MGTYENEREGVRESEGGFMPVLLTGTWPILELYVSPSCPKGALRGKGTQIPSDSFSVLELEVKARARRMLLHLHHHNPGDALCLYSVFWMRKNRGSERLSEVLRVTQLVSDIRWIYTVPQLSRLLTPVLYWLL